MLTFTWLELLVLAIPECLIFVYGVYKLANKPIYAKRFTLSVLLMTLCGYLVRQLPIQFGVHTLITIMIFIIVSIYVNHIEMFKAITSILLLYIIRLVTEWFNFFLLQKIFSISIESLFDDPVKKVIYTLPSLFMFFISVFIVHYVKDNRWNKE
ncbi:MAG: hypothetical protein GYA02_09125 [Clostridiaceae bacterium]|nr:hypothetical protein [Clostridiaceae bacterium]